MPGAGWRGGHDGKQEDRLTVGSNRTLRFDANLAFKEGSALQVAQAQVGHTQLEVDALADQGAIGVVHLYHDGSCTAIGAGVNAERDQAICVGQLGATGG